MARSDAEDLAGPYDVIARCRRPVWISWAGWWSARIQVVDGVTRTLTCTCSIGSRVMRHRRPALCLVELRGFEPLTPCMPSRDHGKSAPTKPRITRHHTEAVVVTRGVSRGLVRLEVLPRCCPPSDLEHAGAKEAEASAM
jgi:hypothetical protein